MKIVDLFCGTGGFSLGAHAAGFEVVQAIDVDPILTSSFALNFPGTKLDLIDVGSLNASDLKKAAGGHIDGIIGGPPCQGFSLIGKRDSNDPRRRLVDHFFRLVSEIRPTFFVMENVVGLMQGDALAVLESAMSRIPSSYDIVGPTVLNASDFGVPTTRRRCFVVGVLREHADIPELTMPGNVPKASVRDAIADLANAKDLGVDKNGFDRWKLLSRATPHGYAASLHSDNKVFSGNMRTKHSRVVSERFATILPGKTDPVGRHYKLSWDGLCPTLRAGTGSDKGSYQSVRPLHPEEPRVITVREAARLQGFSDSHQFHPTIWHSFRMIGNSVAPAVSKHVLSSVATACGLETSSSVAAE